MRVAILTPGLGEEKRYDALWRAGFANLSARFTERGHVVIDRPWTDDAPLDADIVLPLLAWGYHHDLRRWMTVVDALEAADACVCNPPPVLRWNADKRYLGRLADHGAITVPTMFVETADADTVREAAVRFETDTVVVKPQVSGGASGTIRIRVGDPLDGGPTGPAMIQPYLPVVAAEGELSILFFGGAFSHALTKTATGGDFRVQPQYGGRIRPAEPDEEAFAAAALALGAVEESLLYARVDLIRDLSGRWALMELELIEPHLFLDEAPDGGLRFVEAVEFAVANN